MPTAHTIEDVYERLRSVLAPNYTTTGSDDSYIDQFLNDLRSSRDANSTRLLINLGIDVNNYHKSHVTSKDLEDFKILVRKVILKTKEFVSATKTYPPELLPPAHLFAFALREFDIKDLKPFTSVAKSDNYVRISNFRSYIEYIVIKNKSVNKSVPAAIDKTRLGRLYKDFEKGRKYRSVNVCKLSSKKGWVFLARKGDIDHLITKKDVKELLDNLGFYLQAINPDDKFIAFEYPTVFNQPLFQPTSLTADWGEANDTSIGFGNEFFLSYKTGDGWGRTFSVSGQSVRIKEQIHFPLDNDDKDKFVFSATPLGQIAGPLRKADLMIILKEALNRYTKSL